MFEDIIRKANELLADGQPFAIAVVVRREAPISGRTGDKAIIQADGKIAGWVGGGCTQPVIIKEAQNAIKDGQPRFVRVTPASSKDHTEGILEYNMTCHSGGTIDVYIEPVLPKTQLIILGKSPVAQTLAKLGKVLHYQVRVFAPEAEKAMFPEADALTSGFDLSQLPHTRGEAAPRPSGASSLEQTAVVVSTQGQGDEEALQAALQLNPKYLAFVASRKKAEAVFQYLKEKGATEEQLKRIKVPAGLDINAHLPEEIAVSILAEIIQIQRSPAPDSVNAKGKANIEDKPEAAKDPICGMEVEIKTAKYISEYQGETYYFCCAGCKQTFDKSPEKYLATNQASTAPRDPVCGMSVDPGSAKYVSEHQGETYYFCCAGCKKQFDKNPELYLSMARD